MEATPIVWTIRDVPLFWGRVLNRTEVFEVDFFSGL